MKIPFTNLELSFARGKSTSPEAAAWLRGDDVGYEQAGTKLTSPYSQSAWVYIAISRLAEKVASIPFRISRMDVDQARRVRAWRGSSDARQRRHASKMLGETIVESGEVVDLFARPHPSMDRQLFWEMVVTWSALRGEYFIVPLDGDDQPVNLTDRRPRVERLLTLEPGLFWHVVTGYNLDGWRYTGSPLLTPLPSEFLLPGEVIHSRTPNPFLFWRGMSPLVLAMLPAQADFAASKYNQGYWLNNADTGVIVTTDQQPTPEQRAAINAALRERKRKAGTADRPLFLWGGAKVEKPTLTGMEATMIANRQMNRREILAIWKMSDSVIGFTDDKSSALSGGGNAINAEELKFVESTICPICERAEAALAPVVRTFGEGFVGWFDVESLPVMQEARRARLDAGVKAFNIGVTFNDLNRVYDLGFPEYAWGNKSYLPFSLQEAGESPELPSEEEPGKDEEKSNPLARMQKLLGGIASAAAVQQRSSDDEKLWQSHMRARSGAVKMLTAKVAKVFTKHRALVLENLQKAGETRSLIDFVLDVTQLGKDLVNAVTPSLRGILAEATVQMLKEVGEKDDAWQFPSEDVLRFITNRTQPIQDASTTVRDQLNAQLEEALIQGETMDEITGRVRTVFNNLTKYEAERIARTETHIAYNTARHQSARAVGVQFKAWLSSRGPNVRPAHRLAEQTYSRSTPIPMDEPFMVAGEPLMYPGDPSGAASNIINCQCIQLAVKAPKT